MNGHVLDDAPAYAVGALERGEKTLIEEHLRQCSTCRAEVDRFSEIAALMPLALSLEQPEPDLKRLILKVVRAELPAAEHLSSNRVDTSLSDGPDTGLQKETQPLSISPPQAAATEPIPLHRPSRYRTRLNVMSLLAAAAVVLFAVGLTVGHIVSPGRTIRQAQPPTPQARYARLLTAAISKGDRVTGLRTASGVKIHADMAIAIAPSGATSLIVGPTTPPPIGKVYQIWYIRKSRPTSLGVVKPDSDEATTIDLSKSIVGFQLAAMTVESAPNGSTKGPTTTPFVTASFS